MEEKKNNVPDGNWTDIIHHYADMQKAYDESKDRLASEVLADSDRKDARKSRIITYLIGVIIALIVGLVVSNLYWIYQWNSYDYVSQDGEGYNYYNSDVEGDISNGAEDQTEEE